MTEYLIFIHGVNTREERDHPDYARQLIESIESLRPGDVTIKFNPLYWGDLNITAEKELLKDLKESSIWNQIGLQEFRTHQLIQFIGDGALYISRAGGQLIVEHLKQQAMDGLRGFNPATDHMHIISHSMGTIILFDILFSSRWDAENAGGYRGVEDLRDMIFRGGTPVRSIHTMGSPIALFTLTMFRDSAVPNTHDVTARLGQYLQELSRKIKYFPWRNYVHPMDIIASPIEGLVPKMFNVVDSCLNVKDILTEAPDLLNTVSDIVVDAIGTRRSRLEVDVLRLALLGGRAHSSYWTSPVVASSVVQALETVVRESQK
jgi:hypothetical protein